MGPTKMGNRAEEPAHDASPEPPSLRAVWSASADRYRALIEAADDAILVADVTGRVREANPAACELFGYSPSELGAASVEDLFAPEDAAIAGVLREVTALERAWHPNLPNRRKDGSSFWGELRAKVFESAGTKLVLLIVRDVTHRIEKESELARANQTLEEAQASLLHSSKLAAIGQIAGGVAHEVNNPATFMLANLRAMRDSVAFLRRSVSTLRRELATIDVLPEDKRVVVEGILGGGLESVLREMSEMVEDDLSGIERIASIVNDLRVFSRIEQDDVQRVQVNDVIDAACNLAFADIRHRARLVKELSRLPLVKAEPGKLAQVFTNLLLSTAHCIEEGAATDHELRVSTHVEGERVSVVIRGTGPRAHGPASREYGAALGLSLSFEIVRIHGGEIKMESREGEGPRFEVRLPALAPEPQPAVMREGAPDADGGTGKQRARVLVIDDDLAVLRAYRRMLQSRHDVVLAAGGAEGLELLAKDDGFDVILCDVMMPQVDGPMVYEALKTRAPEVAARMVFCSGGAFTPRAKEFLAGVGNAFLQKPIDPEALEAAIVRAKGRRGPSPGG